MKDEEQQGFGLKKDNLSLLKDWRILLGVVVLAAVLVGGAIFVLNKGRNLGIGERLAKVTPTPTQTSTPTPPPLPTATVFITNSGFVPEKLEAKLGTTLTFLNMTGGDFDIRSDDIPELNIRVGFGKTRELKLTKSGTYSYSNSNNPGMKSTLVVRE